LKTLLIIGNLGLFPSQSDIVNINDLNLMLKIINQCGAKHFMKLHYR